MLEFANCIYIYIFARVKEIGLRQNTRVINAHSCLSTTYSFSPLVVCSLVPNPHLPSQVFPLITDFIDSQHCSVWCFSYFHNSLREKKNQQQQQQQQNTNKNKKKIKKLPLKTPKQTAIYIYYFSLFFPFLYTWLLT